MQAQHIRHPTILKANVNRLCLKHFLVAQKSNHLPSLPSLAAAGELSRLPGHLHSEFDTIPRRKDRVSSAIPAALLTPALTFGNFGRMIQDDIHI